MRMHAQHARGLYSKIISGIRFNVDSEIAATDWSVEKTRGSCQHWGPRIYNKDMGVR